MLQRQAWLDRIAQAEPRQLVFLDETSAKTNMTRIYARARKHERARDFAPNGHWKTTTLVAGMTWQGPVAPMVLDGPMDALAFEAYIVQVLIPSLPEGSIIVMDNLPAHKTKAIIRHVQQARMHLWFLPPYSPDYNPIELMWAKVKNQLRSAKARAQEELLDAIASALASVSSNDAKGFLRHCFVGIVN